MAKEDKNEGAGTIDAEFDRLFWEARREHNLLRKKTTTNDPRHQAARKFAKEHGWLWAEELLEASRLDRSDKSNDALQCLTKLNPAIPERWRGVFHIVLGTVQSCLGKNDEAISVFRKALDDPNFRHPGVAWHNIGW